MATAPQQFPTISVEKLAHLVESKSLKILIIDTRSFLEYNTGCILDAVNVCCSRLVKKRLQQGRLSVQDLLLTSSQGIMVRTPPTPPEEETPQSPKRQLDPDIVIVYDQCSESVSCVGDMAVCGSFVAVLLHRLADQFKAVRLLQGGYLQFNSAYPHLCESKSNEIVSGDCPLPGPTPPPSMTSSLSHPAMSTLQGPTKVLNYLYVGSQADSLDGDVLRRLGITHILNVSSSCPQTPHIPENHFLRISVNDGYIDKLLPHFQNAFQFLEKVRESSGRCLVHCLAGISRSPTLAIAYIMKHMKMSHEEAYRFVKEKRPNISPNFNFLGQLLEFEKQLKRGDLAEPEERPEAKRSRTCFLKPLPLAATMHSPTTALSQLSFTPRGLTDFPTTSLDQLKCTPCLALRSSTKRLHPTPPPLRPKSVAVSSFRAALVEQALYAYASDTTEKVRKCQSESHLADFLQSENDRLSTSTSKSSSLEILQVS